MKLLDWVKIAKIFDPLNTNACLWRLASAQLQYHKIVFLFLFSSYDSYCKFYLCPVRYIFSERYSQFVI